MDWPQSQFQYGGWGTNIRRNKKAKGTPEIHKSISHLLAQLPR
jgi:hypothetical protein